MAVRETWVNGVLVESVDIPDPEPETPTAPEVVAAQVIREEIDTRLAASDVNSIAEMKVAIRDGLDAAVIRLGG